MQRHPDFDIDDRSYHQQNEADIAHLDDASDDSESCILRGNQLLVLRIVAKIDEDEDRVGEDRPKEEEGDNIEDIDKFLVDALPDDKLPDKVEQVAHCDAREQHENARRCVHHSLTYHF